VYRVGSAIAEQLLVEAVRRGVGSEPGGLDDRRAIAVLPFLNFSGDPEEEFFADGITEDNHLDARRLARLPGDRPQFDLQLQGPDRRHQKVGQELGARYVVEGSGTQIRPSGTRHGAV